MDGQSNRREELLSTGFRQTNVWKEMKTGAFFRTAWAVSDVSLLFVIATFSLAEVTGWLVPLLWAGGLLAGRTARKHKKPLPAHEHLLSGLMGLLCTMLFSTGARVARLYFCTVLLGFSAALCLTSGTQERLAKLCRYFGDDEEAVAACRRELFRRSVLPNGVLTVFMMLLLQRRMAVTVNLLALCASLCLTFSALNDPVDRRVLEKLELLERREQEGKSTATLRAWLNGRLMEKYRRPWAILLVENVIRIFYRHQVLAETPLSHDDDDPIIYMCNHGNMYGPVVGYVFTPTDVCPWTISNVMVDLDETVAYLYKYTFSHVSWIPKRLRMPITVLVSRLGHWGFRALESIPVYRDHPMELMKTFRSAMTAMERGDDMLIFPENPNAAGAGHGYEHQGVGELFSGFAMIGQLWYRKTGRCCRFVPMYADQEARTLRVGTPVIYDPQNEAAAERQRISDEVAAEMNRLADVA